MTLKNAFIASSLAVALGFGGAALLTATTTYAYDETSTSAINVDEQRSGGLVVGVSRPPLRRSTLMNSASF